MGLSWGTGCARAGPGTEDGQATSIPAPRPRSRRWLVLLLGLVFLFLPAAAFF